MLVILGLILTAMGVFFLVLYISSQTGPIDPAMLLAYSPLLVVGIPSFIIGIFLFKNPRGTQAANNSFSLAFNLRIPQPGRCNA